MRDFLITLGILFASQLLAFGLGVWFGTIGL